jgi:L-alanine-DL-glutamate epimerase-like enolase superfamily enzyme
VRTVLVRHETWTLKRAGMTPMTALPAVDVVLVEIREGAAVGRGECAPSTRDRETVAGVVAQIKRVSESVVHGASREVLASVLPPGAARNALDCALWDLEAKRTGTPVWRLAGLPEPTPVITAFSIGLDSPERMAAAAVEAARHPLLRLELSGEGDVERVSAVRAAVPDARLIVDAGEAWQESELPRLLDAMARHGVELVEQPLPADWDVALGEMEHPVPVCADESCHTVTDLAALADRYEAVNVKLDKAGGFTGALNLVSAARERGLDVVIDSLPGTSLLAAPATLLTSEARWVTLDGLLRLAQDREQGLRWDGRLHPPAPALWG